MTITSIDMIATSASICAALIALDIVSGILSAASRNDIDSSKLRLGLIHKLAFVLAYALAVVLELAESNMPMGLSVPLIMPVAIYITLTEACSIYENLKLANPDLHISHFEDLFRFSAERKMHEFTSMLDNDIEESDIENTMKGE